MSGQKTKGKPLCGEGNLLLLVTKASIDLLTQGHGNGAFVVRLGVPYVPWLNNGTKYATWQ